MPDVTPVSIEPQYVGPISVTSLHAPVLTGPRFDTPVPQEAEPATIADFTDSEPVAVPALHPTAGASEGEIDVLSPGLQAEALKVTLRPNPALDRFYVDVTGSPESGSTMQLVDGRGRVLRTRSVPAGHRSTLEIDATDLPAGSYTVVISDGRARVAEHLVLSR